MYVTKQKRCRLITALMMATALSACAGLPTSKDMDRLTETPIEERQPAFNLTAQEATNFFGEQAVTVLETAGGEDYQLSVDVGQKVPEVSIGTVNAAPMKFGPLLNQISEQVGMSWRISGPGADELMERDVYFVQRSETMLATVLDEISRITNSFYRVEGDRIIFSADELFVARVPRMADSQETLVSGLQQLGASEIFSDTLSGTVTFRANRPAYEGAVRLMSSLEKGRDMIVYDFWIIDRSIMDENRASASFGGEPSTEDSADLAAAFGLNSDSTGASVSKNLGAIDVNAGVNFIRKLGNSKTVAKPTITMLSGGESSFESNKEQHYVSSRTTTTEKTNIAETSRTTQNVDKLETGVKINVKGAHSGGVISSDFEIDISEFLGFYETKSGDEESTQPNMIKKTISSHLEARPGDVMIVGGIINDREDNNRSELGGTGIATGSGRLSTAVETIILVRPRLVQIRPAAGAPRFSPSTIENGVGRVKATENSVGAVMEDEAKARDLLNQLK